MDLEDKKHSKLINAFSYAFAGILFALKTERNIRIHFLIAAIVVLFAFIFSVSALEWMLLLIVIGVTISLELVNTAIESIVDLITEEHHPLAKAAKDIAAGAVLVSCIMSVIVGLIIFLPRFFELF